MKSIYCFIFACAFFNLLHGISEAELRTEICEHWGWSTWGYINQYTKKHGALTHDDFTEAVDQAAYDENTEKRIMLLKGGAQGQTPLCTTIYTLWRMLFKKNTDGKQVISTRVQELLKQLKDGGLDLRDKDAGKKLKKKYPDVQSCNYKSCYLYTLLFQDMGKLLCDVAKSKTLPREYMQQLLDFGVPVGVVWEEYGRSDYPYVEYAVTPLRQAAYNGNTHKVKLLLQHKASAAPQDNDGFQLLNDAMEHGDVAMAESLLNHSAEVNCKNRQLVAGYEGGTPLEYIVKYESKRVDESTKKQLVLLLLEHKANVSEKCKKQKYVRDAIQELQEKQT